ncbi:MAG: ornithine carbamoyltransferase [Thermodesulfovibrio sp.]|uniref:ornithine carbamoyltransferase n=1 Tax=unclassified Thermodesulfovibrio TaxID=2645936 RepID=UPI00083A4DDB|nr:MULTISPECIES: ornithine carbamoyltransferase [unclassified Thermodesulfovibrio]MDI1472326.1 ornithine carbamoyltransferase [Thermodesulfovibrio sp. 1176]MDI6714191.1 ornithine carbamoyltransferase [Thermodesulfovibrio sp.]ODA43510.1 Ornithine carbamoyltransferase [Thermodesulfovibrio sp. N1]
MKRDYLRVSDLNKEEFTYLIKRAIDFKANRGFSKNSLPGKSIGMIFEKPSTRTRVSFEVAIYQLGGYPVYLSPRELQLSRGETIKDTAQVLSRYLDAVVIRTFSHKTIEEFAKWSTIPVINALTDEHHPCQALADMMTIIEKKRKLQGIKLTFVGDGNNVANSLIEASALVEIKINIATPEGCEPLMEIIEKAKTFTEVEIFHDPQEAVKDADVIYTDVWLSMGEEENIKKKEKFKGFQLNTELLKKAKSDAIVMHCLPAHRGEEITDEVLDSPQSVVLDQAENRLYTEKAILEFLLTLKN